jgi:N-methylhydantoinase A
MSRAVAASSPLHPWKIGIDVGGTFTDLAAVNESTGVLLTGKSLTTPENPIEGILQVLASTFGPDMTELIHAKDLLHGTTLAINTLIERSGVLVGLLTTKGFRDVIETGREDRYDLYDLQIEGPEPLVPREFRIGISERLGPDGNVLRALDQRDLTHAVKRLRKAKVGAVAICFLHSYSNDKHEHIAAELVARELPGIYVSISSEVAPIIREYERFLATTINSYIGPRVGGYLGALTGSLSALGFTGRIGIMKSDGGVCTPDEAKQLPIRMLESGPAAGVTYAARIARTYGIGRVLAFDMGGTTAKACLVIDGEPTFTEELEVARRERLRRGSGLPVRLPSIDLIEVGAGGGSIARVGPLGLLQVGPESAGADPGPACYKLGGTWPTVTDADLVLGYLHSDSFGKDGLRLSATAAARSIDEHILEPLRLKDVTVAAWGIHDLVNENMTRAVRLHCVEHGIDPSTVTVLATGGAAPLHAASLMSKLGCVAVICPRNAGVGSALGLVVAPWTVERTLTEIHPLEDLDARKIKERLDRLEEVLRKASPGMPDTMESKRFVYMRVRGQGYEVRVGVSKPLSVGNLAKSFQEATFKHFGHGPAAGAIEVVSWTVRLVQSAHTELPAAIRYTKSLTASKRRAFLGLEAGWRSIPVFDYGSLHSGFRIAGPALVEEPTCTVLIGRQQRAMVDERGNLRIEPSTAGLDLPTSGPHHVAHDMSPQSQG